MSSTTSQVSVDSVDGLHCLWRRPGVYCPAERAKRKCPIDNIRGSTKVPAASAKRGSTLRTARKGDHMKFGSRQTILGATGILMVCLVGVAMISGQAAQGPKPQMAEDVFKNVQLLKGIPVDEFMDTMGMISAALGMNCLDCHTGDSDKSWERFGADTALKRTSRRMIQMVSTINKDNFAGTRSVTCWTCHRGDLRPKVVPNLTVQYTAPSEDPNEVDIPPAPAGASADQIINKYIQALGGAQRLAGLTSFA